MADPSLLNEVKSEIRCLLISTSSQMTVGDLCKDYREITGNSIPYSKLGFRTTIEFLKSVPDVVQVFGSDPRLAIVSPIVTKNLENLNSLVMRQKDSKKRKRKRKPAQTSTMRGYRMSRPLYSPRTTVTKSPTNNYFNKSMNSVSPKRTSPLLARRLNISNKTYNSSMRTVSNNNNILNSSNTSMSDHKSKTISRQQTQDRNMVSSSSTGSVRTRSNSNNSINSLPSIKSSPEPSNNSYCSINNTRDVQKPIVTKSIHTAMSQELSCDYIKNVSQTSPTINNLNKPKGIETLNDQKSAEIQNIAKSPKGFFDSEDNASDKSSSVQHPDLSHHISDKIRNNLKTLIKNFPKGVSLTSIDSHYENNFGEKLSYNELGFPNALEFFLQLSDIFWLERISEFGEFILFDQSLKIPEDLIKNLKVQEKGVEKDIEDVSAVCKDETFKKIVEICNSEETLSGMMGPGDVIESIWNKCKFSCGCLMRIIITEIYDPTKFWFVLDDDHFQLMNKMMDEMQEYYEKNQESLKINNLQKNMYCAASYANSWQRAYIVDVEETTKVKLFFIDYGSLIVADTSTIRYLSKDFQSLPKQVIRGRLDFIIPTNNSTHWDLFVCRFFFKLIEERRLLCLTTEIDEENNIIWMTIKDFEHHKTNPETLTLNEILVKKGYAAICPDAYCITKPQPGNCRMFMDYLLPMFSDLENGSTYTYSDLLRLEKNGYNLYFIIREIKRFLKQTYKEIYNLDLTNNNLNCCGHFMINRYRYAETEKEKEWIENLDKNALPYNNDPVNAEVPSASSGETDTEGLEHLRVYSIGGHDMYCTVVNYRIYVLTEEFIKKLMPNYTSEEIATKMNIAGLKCRSVKITLESHPEIFLEFQRANIPIEVKDDSVLQLTPLRSLDMILYAFKISNPKVSEDVESIFKDVACSE